MLETGARAFAQGEFALAADAFNHIRLEYQEEPAWVAGELPERLLPLAGFASLKAGLYDQSLEALDLYLAEYAREADLATFARFTKAIALQRGGSPEAARAEFAALRSLQMGTALHDLAAIHEARLSPVGEAIELLTATAEAPTSQRLGAKARLELVRLALDQGQAALAGQRLLEADWLALPMPELASLSFLAFQTGDALRDSDPLSALAALRLVAPRDRLIREQQARISELQAALVARQASLGPEQSLWSDFYKESLAALRAQLDALESSPDYLESLQLRKAGCFLALGRPLEAWLLLERLSLSAPPEIAPVAHLRWIDVARELKAWGAAAAIGRKYLELYPNREDANQALYWIAQAQIEAENHQAAIETLRALHARAADASLQASALYFIGYCHAAQARHPQAIKAFKEAVALQSGRPIAAQSLLWIGICHFASDEPEAAMEAFKAIRSEQAWTFLHAEASYRIAAASYTLGDHHAALNEIEAWLAKYESHAREPEAHLLHGDLLRDAGKRGQALAAYQRVSPELRELRFFAVSNSVELRRDLGDLAGAVSTLEEYARGEIPLPFIGGFFGLWAETLLLDGRPSQAEEVLENAIANYGDNLHAEGIVPLITNMWGDANSVAARIRRIDPAKQPTLASRWWLALAGAQESAGLVAESKLSRLRLVSDFAPENLPPECLVTAGSALLEIGSFEATSYLQRVLDEYPQTEYVSLALYGLAKHAAGMDDPEGALALLSQAEAGYLAANEQIELLDFKARLLEQNGTLEAARKVSEELLANRSASSRLKASALIRLGKISRTQGDPTSAYAFFQRVFTLYRAEGELVAAAYLAAAQILADSGRFDDALAVCRELLQQNDLSMHPAFAEAESLLPLLVSHTDGHISPSP